MRKLTVTLEDWAYERIEFIQGGESLRGPAPSKSSIVKEIVEKALEPGVRAEAEFIESLKQGPLGD